ncbi:MAG: hypothetical protein R2939_11925 [Kofleriaceae bacterium]
MPRWQRAYVIACAGALTGLLVACAVDFGRWPRPYYAPYARAWTFGAAAPPGVSMGYFGIVVWALAAAAIGAGAAALVLRWRATTIAPSVLRLLGAWTLTAAALASAYFTWMIWPL